MGKLGKIKAKGLQKQPYASETPPKLYPITLSKKPEITVTFFERAQLWVSEAWDSTIGAVSKAVKVVKQIPKIISDIKIILFLIAAIAVIGLIIYLVV